MTSKRCDCRKHLASTVEALSAGQNEPDWMLELRRKAWRFFEEIPWPTGNEETWRRTKLTGFKLEDYPPLARRCRGRRRRPRLGACSTAWTKLRAPAAWPWSTAAPALHDARPGAGGQGVIFTDLARRAARASRAGAEVLRHGRRDGREQVQRAALRAVERRHVPVRAAQRHGRAAAADRRQPERRQAGRLPPHPGRDRRGRGGDPGRGLLGADDGMQDSVVELLPGTDSQVHYLHLQNLADTAWNFSTQRMLLGRDSLLRYLIGSWGSRLSKAWINMELVGPGSHGELLGLYFPDGRQHIDHHTNQLHKSPQRHQRPALQGRAEGPGALGLPGLHQGLPERAEDQRLPGQPEPAAEQAGARRQHPGPGDRGERRALHARRDGQPVAGRVRLLPHVARASTRPNAERLVVQGFFEEVLDRIPVEGVRTSWRMRSRGKLGL